MNTRSFVSRFVRLALFAFALVGGGTACAFAQNLPKTLDAVQEIAPNGSVALTISMSFDAAPWKAWKAQVGDEPARLRAMMKHTFSAFAIDDFKFEKNDLDRTAKITMRSAAGPELRKDGSFRIPIEKYFRLVNNSGREWFFSGNNPYAANSLNTVKIVLPPNAREAALLNAGTVDQGLHFRIDVPPGSARGLVIAGCVVLLLGGAVSAVGYWGLPKSRPH